MGSSGLDGIYHPFLRETRLLYQKDTNECIPEGFDEAEARI